MAVTNLTNTKWILNEVIAFGITISANINFTSYGHNYTSISFSNSGAKYLNYNDTQVYNNGVWSSPGYRVIEITGGTDVTNGSLIGWLERYAIQMVDNLTNTKWIFHDESITDIVGGISRGQ